MKKLYTREEYLKDFGKSHIQINRSEVITPINKYLLQEILDDIGFLDYFNIEQLAEDKLAITVYKIEG